MLSNHAGGVVIPFPRPFRAPPPAPSRPFEAFAPGLRDMEARPRRDWRQVAVDGAVLLMLTMVAMLQVAVLARVLGAFGR